MSLQSRLSGLVAAIGSDIKALSSGKLNKIGVAALDGAYQAKHVAMGSSTAIDLSAGNYFSKTLNSGTVTLTVTNVPVSGVVPEFILVMTNPGAATIIWPENARWEGGAAPTFTASGVDIVGGFTLDGGANWRLVRLSRDSK